MMKAVSIKKPGEVKIIEVELREPKEDEVTLKITYIGICGSDLSTYMGKNPLISYPRIPGHEISGVIVKKGSKVPDKFKKGKNVTVIPYSNCGKCASCSRGRHNACEFNETLGVQRDGAMGEYFNVPYQKVLFADTLGEKELALVEPLTVGFHAVSRGRVTNSDTVMVLGCGMIGIGSIVGSLKKGAKVIAVDINKGKLSTAKEMGAQFALDALSPNFESELYKLTNNFGPDVVIEAAGNAHTYRTAIEQVAFTGRVVCIGYAGSDISLPTHLIVKKEIDIMGSRNANMDDFQAVIEYLSNNPDKSPKLISEEPELEGVGPALKSWSENPGKIIKIMTKIN